MFLNSNIQQRLKIKIIFKNTKWVIIRFELKKKMLDNNYTKNIQ